MWKANGEKVFVVGVGMTKFEKPGRRDWDYPDMGKIAIERALRDSSLSFDAIEQACVGYVFGDSTCGQRAVYSVGMTGIPVYNVNNNCSTGSTALFMARQLVQGGLSECVLALGFEKMERGSLSAKYTDRTNPMDKHAEAMMKNHEVSKGPFTPQLFGNAGREHMKKYGTTARQFAAVAAKNHKHSANNPYSQFRDVYTVDQIMASPKVFDPLTKLQCCPTSDGAGAVILCSEAYVNKHGLHKNAIEIAGQAMATDTKASFGDSMIKTVGGDMTASAAAAVYKQSGLTAADVQVVELHDCFSCNELITYEGLQLCETGKGGWLVESGNCTYGGKYVVNPSGGLISKGHPLGATGLAQCAELCWQLRGVATNRQVKDARVALQHNLGLGGACVVTLYTKPSWPGVDASVFSKQSATDRAAVEVPNDLKKKKSGGKSGPGAAAVFADLEKRLSPELVAKVKASYRFTLGKQSWLVDLKSGSGSISQKAGKADCEIKMKEKDFVLLMTGKLDPMKAFMQGKLQVKGNPMLAQKLKVLMKAKAKL